MLKLGLIQMRCSINPLENVDKAEAMIRKAVSEGAQIICLQEIFNTIYFCQTEDHGYFRFAEGIPGPTTTRLGKVARELGVADVREPEGVLDATEHRVVVVRRLADRPAGDAR